MMRSDPDIYLNTDHLQESLRDRSVSGAAITLGAQWIRFALNLGSVWVLAHLLTPADFGLVGMVTAVTGFILLFKDMGLSAATVQRREIRHEQVSTLFWVNVGLSALLMALTALAAPLIARFYDEPRVAPITLALAGGFLLGGVGLQHQALLSRQMRFRAMAVVEITAQAVGVVAALTAAWFGAGYWALIAQQLAMAAAHVAGLWVACGWRPGLPVRGSGVRPMLRFGGNLTGFSVVNYFARNLDDILIGRVWGSGALGLYNRAYALLLMPLRQINAPVARIAVPTLSRLQDQPERFRRYYLRAVRLVALACMPLIALLFVVSREVVQIVLGPQWTEAAGLFSIMAVAAFLQPVVNTGGWIYVALGQTGRMVRWGALFAAITCASFVGGLPWGARGVAIAYTAAIWTLAVPSMWAALRCSPVRLAALGRNVAGPAALGLVVGGAGSLARHWLPPVGPFVTIAVVCTAAALAGGVLALVWPSLRRDLAGLRTMMRDLRKPGEGGTP